MNRKKLFGKINSRYWISLVAIAAVLSFSFGNKERSIYNTNWLIVEVDTAGTGYFKVNPANHTMLRMNKNFIHDQGHNMYLLNGSKECCQTEKIKDREWQTCWVKNICSIRTQGELNEYAVHMFADRDNLFGFQGSIQSKLEYKWFLIWFLVDSKGKATVHNDTLVFDMKVQMMARNVPFKIKCVRDSVQ